MSRPPATVDPDELYNVVAGAASQDPTLVTSSATRLKEMLDMHGTFDCLTAIAAQRSVPLNIRRQAIIQFKNNALANWRGRRLTSDAQKIQIRGRCLTFLDEEDDVIADCNKINIAKMARVDYPLAWPNLMQDLLSASESALNSFVTSGGSDPRAALVLGRSLDIVNYILKEFSSIKMPAGIKTMGKLVEGLHLQLQEHYNKLSSNFPSIISTSLINERSTADVIACAHTAYKCLSRMAVWAWHRINLNSFGEMQPWVVSFFEGSAIQLQGLEELRITVVSSLGSSLAEQPTNPNASRSIDYLTRHIRQYGKLFRRMQQLNCSKFVALSSCSDLVLYYWSKVVQATNGPPEYIADSQYAVFPVRFIVQAMVLFKESLGQWSLTKKGPNGAATFSEEFVNEAVKLLVTRFIPLNPKDLDAWLADPEEWANLEDKENEQWEYELRPCGERVLMALANQYRDFVTPLLKATFDQIVGVPASDLNTILQKEALYCAIGRCARRLVDVIPFQDWIANSLTAEVRDPNPNFPILKRRIAWLLGKLVSDECIQPGNNIWHILIHLLTNREPGSDQVVRFTAASSLRECVDSLQFSADSFMPFLPAAVSQLLDLMAEADTLEAKRRVTQSLNVVIESMDDKIVPYMETISNAIPQLWISAEGDFLYKAVLLETVSKLVAASKQDSVLLNSITVPLLQDSFSDSLRIGLDEDALDLWKTCMRNAVTLESVNGAPSLLQLFPIAIALLSENLDLLGSSATVVKSYLVLDAPTVVQAFASPLFNALSNALEKAIQTNQKDMIILLQLVVRLSPSPLWADAFHASNVFSNVISSLMEDKSLTMLLTEQVCLFARIALNDPRVLSQLMSATAVKLNKPEKELWDGLLDQWWRRFDNMSEPRYRKLAAMGIACLVAEGRPEVLERLNGEIFNLWLDVFGEMKEALVEIQDEDSENTLSTLSALVTFWKDSGTVLPDSLDDIVGTPEHERWRQIYLRDPVETQKLTTFVGQKLQQAQTLYGPVFESTYLKDTDPGVLKQLKEYLSS
ncbi:ARM repeat-containing protein [Fomitiporia mediterranea MF3/22]|uniref:ARM repeat-containing protein n=1 Tax=Fomitiporia mediterranea (strain MF3/22) TaxID=694068 RepID=UPI0004407D0D|nr:ARM repeat-containing protein [Fomitiporia mediterranea MF3/22]EJD01395.1 ARM repeat-containing protein [Fomitiporia mediterranea MF3/22]